MCSGNLFSLDKIRCQIHQNLEGSATEQTLHQVVPSESLAYGEDDNKQGRDSRAIPHLAIPHHQCWQPDRRTITRPSEGKQIGRLAIFPRWLFFYTYIQHLKGGKNFPVL